MIAVILETEKKIALNADCPIIKVIEFDLLCVIYIKESHMKIKSLVAGLVASATMVLVVGPIQAACVKYPSGWHMVSKKCNIKPAANWQQYNSGVYTQPRTGKIGLLGM